MSNFIFNPWKVLGVHRGTPNQEIQDAFRRLAQANHPDRRGDLDTFRRVTEAWRILRNRTDEQNHITVMSGLGTECQACGAQGYRRKQISFTAFNVTACKECEGCGYHERARRVRTP